MLRLIAIPRRTRGKQPHQQMPVGFRSRSAGDALDLCCCSNNSQGFCEACCDATKSQTSVCGNEKVSQMPSGGWSYFDSRPTAHPSASDTDGQHIWPDCLWLKLHPSIIFFLIYSQSCFDKTDGVLCGANNATFDNTRRSAVCGGIFGSLSP